MTKRNDKENVRMINNAIKSNIEKEDWEKLSGNLSISLRYGGSIRLRKLAAKKLGEALSQKGDWIGAIAAYEHARALSPTNRALRSMEVQAFQALLDRYESVVTKKDLQILKSLVEISFPKPPKRKKIGDVPDPEELPEEKILRWIDTLYTQAPEKPESSATFHFLEIFDSIDPNLTPDQRLERAAKILAPYVVEYFRDKRKLEENNGAVTPVDPGKPVENEGSGSSGGGNVAE